MAEATEKRQRWLKWQKGGKKKAKRWWKGGRKVTEIVSKPVKRQ